MGSGVGAASSQSSKQGESVHSANNSLIIKMQQKVRLYQQHQRQHQHQRYRIKKQRRVVVPAATVGGVAGKSLRSPVASGRHDELFHVPKKKNEKGYISIDIMGRHHNLTLNLGDNRASDK